MAKKTKPGAAPAAETQPTNTAAAPAAAAPAAAPAPPVKAGTKPTNKDVFHRNYADGKPFEPKKADGTAIRIAPQAQVIVNCITALQDGPNGGVTREALTAALPKAGLVTKQPADRITVYYQKGLVKDGFITLTKQTSSASASAPASAPPVHDAVVDENNGEE